MNEISYPPKIIPLLSPEERANIARLIYNRDKVGLAWLEKIRKFISFHNRNLKKVSIGRFNNQSNAHLGWFKEIMYHELKKSEDHLADSAILNAVLILKDACHFDAEEKKYLESRLAYHQDMLISMEACQLKSSATPTIDYSFKRWFSKTTKNIPVTVFCPSPYSLFSITAVKILQSLNIEIKAIVILKFSSKRIKSELYRDGLSLFFKRVWRKLILRADENNVYSKLSLKNLKDSIASEVSDIRLLAKNYNISCHMVNCFSETIDLEKNKNGDLCLFTGGGLINKEVLNYFSLGVINIHMGPLPQYKGMDVVEAPILDGAFENVALTSHLMKPALDTGPLISEITFFSDEYSSLGELRNEMGAMMPLIAVDSIISILSESASPREQELYGQQYYFIHPRLRDIISNVMPERFHQLKTKSNFFRAKKLKFFNSIIVEMQKNVNNDVYTSQP
jgi:methionyl-tRNA formyltransferase